jgi:hypothetical protein
MTKPTLALIVAAFLLWPVSPLKAQPHFTAQCPFEGRVVSATDRSGGGGTLYDLTIYITSLDVTEDYSFREKEDIEKYCLLTEGSQITGIWNTEIDQAKTSADTANEELVKTGAVIRGEINNTDNQITKVKLIKPAALSGALPEDLTPAEREAAVMLLGQGFLDSVQDAGTGPDGIDLVGLKEVKLFYLIPIRMTVTITTDSAGEQIQNVAEPWWGVLTNYQGQVVY